MKNVLTADQMREADRRTIAAGDSGRCSDGTRGDSRGRGSGARVCASGRAARGDFCGKGNNGGDGFSGASCERAGCGVAGGARRGASKGGDSTMTRTSSSMRCSALDFRGEVRAAMRADSAQINADFPQAKIVAVDFRRRCGCRPILRVTFDAPKSSW